MGGGSRAIMAAMSAVEKAFSLPSAEMPSDSRKLHTWDLCERVWRTEEELKTRGAQHGRVLGEEGADGLHLL